MSGAWMFKKKRTPLHPADRAERAVFTVLCDLKTACEKVQRAVTLAEVAAVTGMASMPRLERCLDAARASGHATKNTDGCWYPTAEGWDRNG